MSNKQWSTLVDFIANSNSTPSLNDVVDFLGCSEKGVGASSWKCIENTGAGTPSQSPTLSNPNLTDGSGNEWAIIDNGVSRLNAQLGLPEDFESQKYSGRTLLGDASQYNENAASPVHSWLGQDTDVAPNGSLQPNLGYMERNATVAGFASTGSIGIVGASHSRDITSGAAIGLIGAGVNDNEVNSNINVWGLYLDAKCYANALGATFGAEIAVANLGDYVDQYDVSNRKTTGTLYAAGADEAINGLTEDCTLGINFTANGAKWGGGISFGAASLRTFTDGGSESFSKAVVLRNSMQIGWENSSGLNWGYVRSSISDDTMSTSLTLRNDNVAIRSALNDNITTFTNGGVGNYFDMQSRNNAAPRISALGVSTDIDIRLIPKGSGTLDLEGTGIVQTASVPANFVANEIITIKVNGVNYRIPASTVAW